MPESIDLTRRAWLKGAAGFLAASVVSGSSPIAPAQTESDPYKGLKAGIHTYTLRKLPFDEAVRVTRDAGLKFIGFNPIHLALDSSKEKLDAARQFVTDAGLRLMAVGVVSFDADEAKARQAFEYARTMGMPTIVANPSAESLDLLEDLVQEYAVRIAIHNHGPEGIYSVPDDVLRAVGDRHEHMGACIDIGHYERSNVRAVDAIRALKDRFYDMHLKDVDKPTRAGKGVVLGQGIIELHKVFEELLALEYSHHFALEYEGTPDDPVPNVLRCLAYARSVLAEVAG